jgi:hypothetical protein
MLSRRGVRRIFYFCYDNNFQRGGQRDTYRHVDILNSAGIDAAVLHFQENFRVRWFENTTKIVYLKQFLKEYDANSDIVVVPEDLGSKSRFIPGRKVIFNKSLFYGFNSMGYATATDDPYLDKSVIAIFGVSEHNCEHIHFAYPDKIVYRVFAGVRQDIFRWSTLLEKKPQIVYMPKSELQIRSLFNMLQARGEQSLNRAKVFTWIALKGMSELDAAKLMSESFLFLFANIEEGLPQVLLEANTCGCLATTYCCAPLSEIMPPSSMAEINNLLEFCEMVEIAMAGFGQPSPKLQARANEAKRLVKDYTIERQRANVIDVWERILIAL